MIRRARRSPATTPTAGRDPHRPDHDRRGRGRRRGRRDRVDTDDRRRRPARARLVAARRAVDPGGGALARLARPAHRHRLRRRRPGPLRQRPAVPFGALQLFNLLVLAPVAAAAVLWVLQRISYVTDIVGPGPLAAMRGGFYLEQLALAAVVLFGGFARGPGLRRHRAAAPAPLPGPGQGLPRSTASATGCCGSSRARPTRRSSSTSSATAPTSWATCAGSGTACRGRARRARTSAPRSPTSRPTCA